MSSHPTAAKPLGRRVEERVPVSRTRATKVRLRFGAEQASPAPEDASGCPRLPQAPASLGQSATWAALAGHIELVSAIGAYATVTSASVKRSPTYSSVSLGVHLRQLGCRAGSLVSLVTGRC